MGLFSKQDKVNLSFVDGVSIFGKGLMVQVTLEEDFLSIVSKIDKNKKVYVSYDQIKAANCINEKEIIEKSKSTTGRAIAGGVLLGPLGAIVGGMSGIGTKQKSSTHYFIVINYTSKSGETKVISFEVVGASLHWDSFLKELRSKIAKSEVDIEKEIYL